ncbi:MAG: pseudouridine synthase family protein [Verrucomicrobiaceae bacterium]|nr:pseudouridine synthase family protein [Verrucomicrobiaceae bacterium]
MTDIDALGEKLQKVLARAGVGSRRDMEKMIGANRVTVNGRIAHVGDRVTDRDRILVDGHPVALKSAQERRPRVLIYNKPEGEICSVSDPEGRPTVFERLPTVRGERWISVGRLDFNTSGLLLFTTDGELANALMHPSSNIDREYLCRVLGDVSEELLERLRTGVQLDDGIARFTDITEGGSNEEAANRWYYVCLMEGRNREVRRLWESQDVKVSRLKRVRYGPVFLPPRLKQGQWQEMPSEQVSAMYEIVSLKAPTISAPLPEEVQKLERQQRKNRPAVSLSKPPRKAPAAAPYSSSKPSRRQSADAPFSSSKPSNSKPSSNSKSPRKPPRSGGFRPR